MPVKNALYYSVILLLSWIVKQTKFVFKIFKKSLFTETQLEKM